jgi:hypothetical protein
VTRTKCISENIATKVNLLVIASFVMLQRKTKLELSILLPGSEKALFYEEGKEVVALACHLV